jgi:hypothetical protein
MKIIEPRAYQERIVQKTLKAIDEGHQNILIESPMGSGKTVMGLMIARALNEQFGWKTGWTAMRKHLLHQASEENQNTFQLPSLRFFSTFSNEIANDIELEPVDVLIEDEAHHSASATSVENYKIIRPKVNIGLSVGGESLVIVRQFGVIRSLKISELVTSFDHQLGEFHYLGPDDAVEVRAFDGTSFVWKQIKAVLGHKLGDKKLLRIRTALGRTLDVTEDHSVFKACPATEYALVGASAGSRRKEPMHPTLVLGSELQVGDYLILEDSISPNETDPIIDLTTECDQDWVIAGNFEARVRGLCCTRPSGHKILFRRKNGRFGWYLTSAEYDYNDGPGRLYRSGNGHWCSSHLPLASLAYLLGQYVGDGWRDGPRALFAVHNDQVSDFLLSLAELDPYVQYTYSVSPSPSGGNSSEITINNKFIADLLWSLCGESALTKRIPPIMFSATRSTIKEFLRGLMDSDGHLATKKQRYYLTTTSTTLADGLIELLRFVDIAASRSSSPPMLGGVVNGRQIMGRHRRYSIHYSWWQSIGCNHGVYGRRKSVNLKTAGIPVKVIEIETVDDEYVYDIAVADDEWQTFVANGFLVHNTATPFRTDRVKLCYSRIIKDAGIRSLIDQGYLSPFHQYIFQESWTPEAVSRHYLADPARWGKSVVFFNTEIEAQECGERIRAGGVKAEVVTGSSDQETQIDMFNNHDTDVLVNMVVLTEGFDSTILKTAWVRPGSKGPTMQMGGRALRKHHDPAVKSIAQIVQNGVTHQPFTKIASAEMKYVCNDGITWEDRQMNERVNQASRAAIKAIAQIDVKIPPLLKKFSKKHFMSYGISGD